MARKNKGADQDKGKMINSAVQIGMGEIIRQHPRFRNLGGYMARHLDSGKINLAIRGGYEEAKEKKIPRDDINEYVMKHVANYVASGSAFNEKGKEVLLKKGLEDKAKSGFFSGFFARRELAGEKYLDQAMDSFNELHEMFKSGEGYEMPELEKPLGYLNKLGFATPAIEVLRDAGLINGRQYSKIKDKIRKGAKEATREFASNLEKYTTYQKVAAVVLGISGVGLLLTLGTKITGGVIGIANNNETIAAILGGMFIVSSLVLFFKRI